MAKMASLSHQMLMVKHIQFITVILGNDANSSEYDEPIDSNAQNDYIFKSEEDEQNEESDDEEEDDDEGSASSEYWTEDEKYEGDDKGAGNTYWLCCCNSPNKV